MVNGNKLSDRDVEVRDLAAEIINFASNELLVNFRFLDNAIGNVKFFPDDDATFCSDGRYIYYSPWFLLNMYMGDHKIVTRNLLHSLLHCIYRHNLIGQDVDKYLWDLACDIAVENTINSLNKELLESKRQRAQDFAADLKLSLPVLTAERIYKHLSDSGYSNPDFQRLRIPYVGDDHSIWYNNNGKSMDISKVDLDKLWQEISKKMETEIELIHGKDDELTQSLRDINRVRYDYAEFLQKFGVHGELMQLSQEEFDYNYYTYGLELYGDIPLVEPLEYQEENKIRDLVIAIDTSGSVKGEVVQRFIEHTHDILARKELFHSKLNLYIIQCDDQVREAKKLESQEEFDSYLNKMEIKGLGRTDFRPVFNYVDGLRKTGELRKLQGLIYFTDGKGTFPKFRPDYDVAFIINEDSIADVWTPEWAIKLYLSDEEIMDDRLSS